MGSFDRGGRTGGGGFRGGFGGGSRGGRSSFGAPRSFAGNDRGGDRGDRPMFTTTCSNCSKECQVPFRPTNGKPVYCSECFEKMGNRSDSRRPERTEFRPNTSGFDQNKATLDAINTKLDKILSLLQPKITIDEAMNPIVKEPASIENSGEAKETAPKAKKAVKKSAPVKK